ncbi:MAG: hypothetical protein AUJ49_12865 [Desulfovibrionaceae bacterium CG1_02_65_16]|nr:MAG: hypothetical protein AUJ49_12865 [Desulfovibrionaceae bacterium CG1_02_65_16]
MTEITPLSKGAAVESTQPKVAVPAEPRLPRGPEAKSVNAAPTPVTAPESSSEAIIGDSAKRLHVAQMRADITGTGGIVDTIV